jgi:hypothetical protein
VFALVGPTVLDPVALVDASSAIASIAVAFVAELPSSTAAPVVTGGINNASDGSTVGFTFDDNTLARVSMDEF